MLATTNSIYNYDEYSTNENFKMDMKYIYKGWSVFTKENSRMYSRMSFHKNISPFFLCMYHG